MTNQWKDKVSELISDHKVSSAVLATLESIGDCLPPRILESSTLEKTDDYGVNIRWGDSLMEIRQSSAPTLFVWFTFNRTKSDKITTSEERVFTDKDMLCQWLTRHAHEL